MKINTFKKTFGIMYNTDMFSRMNIKISGAGEKKYIDFLTYKEQMQIFFYYDRPTIVEFNINLGKIINIEWFDGDMYHIRSNNKPNRIYFDDENNVYKIYWLDKSGFVLEQKDVAEKDVDQYIK